MVENTEKTTGRRGPEYWAAVALLAGAGLLCVWLTFRCLLGAVLPFLLAYLLSLLIRPLADRLTGRGRIPRGPVAAVLVLLFTGLAVLAAAAAVRRGMAELEQLLLRIGEQGAGAGDDTPTAMVTQALDWVYSVSEHLPFLRKFEQNPGFAEFCGWLDSAVQSAAEELAARLSRTVSEGALLAVRGLPAALLFLVVLLLSCYYFTADSGRLGAAVAARIPDRLKKRLMIIREKGGWFFRRYLRAYLILGLITFGEMLAGLMLLHKPYPLLIALLIAFVDFLPVFGTGTVLLPWALVDCLTGRVPSGLGLLALYGVSLLVRQLIEPKLVGDSLGIHPLLSLAAVYAGYRLFGLPGMILSPFAAAAVKAVLTRRAEGA
ncbi:MAG: sporulation integral membrane protein YtvI [Clostridia bacterium]|nr:sporulation integral membrane protein YtvI [Clostridia bacterium]